jgi:hypothetical protein
MLLGSLHKHSHFLTLSTPEQREIESYLTKQWPRFDKCALLFAGLYSDVQSIKLCTRHIQHKYKKVLTLLDYAQTITAYHITPGHQPITYEVPAEKNWTIQDHVTRSPNVCSTALCICEVSLCSEGRQSAATTWHMSLTMHVETQLPALHTSTILQDVQLKELTHRVHFNVCITQGMCLSPDYLLFSRHHWSSLTSDTAVPSTALSLVNKPLYIWKTNEQRCYLTSILVLPSAKANFHILINNTGFQMTYWFKPCLQYACQELWNERGSLFRE